MHIVCSRQRGIGINSVAMICSLQASTLASYAHNTWEYKPPVVMTTTELTHDVNIGWKGGVKQSYHRDASSPRIKYVNTLSF